MRKRSLLLLTGALVLVTSLVVGPSATAKPERASAGTVVVIHDQEPGILNPFLSEGNGYTVALALNKILASGVIYNDKVQLVPELLEARPKIVKNEPLTVTAQVQEERGLERRQADHGCGLHRHLAHDDEPELGHHRARGLGGHREGRCQGQELHGHLQAEEGLLQLGGHRRRPDHACPQGRRPGLQQALVRLARHRERPLQVRELAEGHAAHALEERGVQGRPGRQARSHRLPLSRRRFAVPGAEERRG